MKTPSNIEEHHRSKRLESVRNDVEGLFGRLKGRFGMLKTTVLFNEPVNIDNAWFTCCIPHNMLYRFLTACRGLLVDTYRGGVDGRAGKGIAPAETEFVISILKLRSSLD